MSHSDEARRQQSDRFRQAVERKEDDARKRAEQEERSLIADDRPQDAINPRAKSSGHGKKTADKWNQ
jgi:hypothetical protein